MPRVNRSFRRRDPDTGKKKSFILSKLNIILVVVLLISSAAVYTLYYSDFFKIKEVIVNPSGISCTNEAEVKKFTNLLGKSILFIDQNWLNQKITERFNCVESISSKKYYPDKLSIDLTERQGNAIVRLIKFDNVPPPKLELREATPSSEAAVKKVENTLDFEVNESSVSSSLLVDKVGFILLKLESADEFGNLPNIYLLGQEINFEKVIPNEFIPDVLTVLQKMTALQKKVQLTKIVESDLYIKSEEKIVFSLTKDILRQLASLQLILQKAKIESKKVEIIDLRFDKPVVVYSPKN
jgi:cell division septal protein FtsQ